MSEYKRRSVKKAIADNEYDELTYDQVNSTKESKAESTNATKLSYWQKELH